MVYSEIVHYSAWFILKLFIISHSLFWEFLKAHGLFWVQYSAWFILNSGQCLVYFEFSIVHGLFWEFITVFGLFWEFSTVLGLFEEFITVHDLFWEFITVLDLFFESSLQCMVCLESSLQCMVCLESSISMLKADLHVSFSDKFSSMSEPWDSRGRLATDLTLQVNGVLYHHITWVRGTHKRWGLTTHLLAEKKNLINNFVKHFWYISVFFNGINKKL